MSCCLAPDSKRRPPRPRASMRPMNEGELMKTKQRSGRRPAFDGLRHRLPPALFALLLPLMFRPAAAQQAAVRQNDALEEIVVTATKRPEAVRSISGAVSAVTGAQLEELGAQSF